MSSSDARLVDFAQARVDRIAEGVVRVEAGSLRTEMQTRVDHEMRDIRSEVILQANQVINAQQQAMRATRCAWMTSSNGRMSRSLAPE